MLDSRQVRIGNSILYNDQIVYVDLDLLNSWEDHKAAGIAMSDAILVARGFKVSAKGIVYYYLENLSIHHDGDSFYLFEEDSYEESVIHIGVPILYVHTLENIFLSLTGKEM
jgi:hypothetical protein